MIFISVPEVPKRSAWKILWRLFKCKLFTVMSSPVCDEHHVEAGGIMNGPGQPPSVITQLLTSYCLLMMGTALSPSLLTW